MHYTLRTKLFAVWAMFLFSCGITFSQSSCPGFKTYTQGGWGSTPSGSNPGTFLNNNFAANFPAPTYLTIGCTNKLQLTSAAAVRAFLPNGVTPAVLPAGTRINPTKTNFSNVFAGQLVALALNLRFDNNIASFGSSSTNLKDLVIANGPFIGKTVQFLFDEANKKIGGCTAFNKTLSEYTTAIDNVNRNYDNGTNTQSFLVCPLTASCTTTPVLCRGASTGSMTVVPAGGRAPFTYTWAGGVAGNVATATGLAAGTYTVTVTDASLQTATTMCTITQPATAVTASDSHTDVSCNGGSNGSVTLTFSGGTGSLQVSFNGAAFQEFSSPKTFSGLAAGIYSWIVKDANNCTVTGSETVDQPTPLVATAVAGQILCYGGTTTVTVSATGGTGSYDGIGTFEVGAGTYIYNVTDANGCSTSVSIEVTEPTQVIAAAVVNGAILCSGGTTTVTVSANGGTPEYTGTGTFTVGAGFYTYDISDSNGCPASVSVNVIQPAPLVASVSLVERIRCNNECNGALNSSVSGGTPAYSYLWSNGATTATISGLCSDGYYLVVTDANGCVALSNGYGLDNPEVLELSAILTVEDDQCGDDVCTGAASVEVSGGEPDYTYVWTGGESDSNELTGLCESAVVSVTVTDARGCEVTSEDALITCVEQECGPHKTFTQGGWGAVPNGNNPGVYLHANFDAAYPSGLTIGCGDNTLSLYSAQEVTDFLPEGGTADALPNLTVLTGQLVAASLNVGFDAYDADFAGSDVALGDLFTDAEGFEGMTVSDILAAANEVIGGCSDAFDFASLNAVLTTINENFDNGTVDNGHLTCTAPAGTTRSMVASNEFDNASTFMLNVYPNPAVDVANVQISATRDEIFEVTLYSMTGELVVKQQHSVVAGTTNLDLQVSELPAMTYVLRVSNANQNKTQIVVVR